MDPHSPFLATPIAAVRASDLGVFVVLALFAWWGARRGAVRQFLSLVVLLASFYGAGRLAPHLVSTVAKISTLEPDERLAAAWGGALFGLLVVGAIALRFVEIHLPEPAEDRRGWLGGTLGLLKGAFIVLVGGYALLGLSGGAAPPALSRGEGAEPADTDRPALVRRVEGSLSARGLARGADLLVGWFHLPPWVEAKMGQVNEQLGLPAPGRRPSGDGRRPAGP